jgi:cytochrome c peroxidase
MIRFFMAATCVAAILVLYGWTPIPEQQVRARVLRAHIGTITHDADAAISALAETLSRQPQSVESIDQAYDKLRIAYKRIEPLIDYIDPTFASAYLNGAPLPKLDAKSQFVDVLPPRGLQVLDELMAERDVSEKLTAAVLSLQVSLREAGGLLRATPWTDRMFLESARSGVMRIMAMGITGFDQPGTAPRLSENIASLETILAITTSFGDSISTQHARGAITVLRGNATFEDFDRMAFIREYLDPLYRSIGDYHHRSGIENVREISPLQPTLEPLSRSMFETNTLNAAASSGLHSSVITPTMVELGRLLFFDPILSTNLERACASCHQPERAFTDGLAKSAAINNSGTVSRNAPTLINSVFARRFFYDLRAQRISDVVSHVVTDHKEFQSSPLEVVERLHTSQEYRKLFAAAFPAEKRSAITFTNVSLALSAYLTTLVSFNSLVDRYLRGEPVSVDGAVRRGFNIFMGKGACASCHFPPSFAGYVPPGFTESESEILGVPKSPAIRDAVLDADIGRAGGISREASAIYRFSFKTPTVRNIALTAPYMHHGAYSTLEQVVEFYNVGGGKNIGIDLEYQTLPFDNLQLTAQEQADLISFMQALTDTVGLTQRPTRLPAFPSPSVNARAIGGLY